MSERLTILAGHCLDRLRELPDESVHCVVTSPPYWALRDYGLPAVEWPTGWKGQHGLEPTPELYIEHEVAVFREVHRVLRSDGTCWVNLGDCYVAAPQGPDMSSCGLEGTRSNMSEKRTASRSFRRDKATIGNIKHVAPGGLRPKNMVGIPWRVAFALQASGWYLRCDIIWHKPNPMPESVRDRPTKAHEYVFLLTKKERYFYDAEAIRESSSPNSHMRYAAASADPAEALRSGEARRRSGVNPKATKNEVSGDRRNDGFNKRWRTKQNESFSASVVGLVDSRNKRSVWTVPTAPYKEAHFATFPPDLIRPCILAGTSAAGCCSECGAPFERVIEKGAPDEAHKRACGADVNGDYNGHATKDFARALAQDASVVKARILAGMRERVTVGWRPTCGCADAKKRHPMPCVVLDPFGGSFTTGAVAIELGRAAIMCELNSAYIGMGRQRCNVTPGFTLA